MSLVSNYSEMAFIFLQLANNELTVGLKEITRGFGANERSAGYSSQGGGAEFSQMEVA